MDVYYNAFNSLDPHWSEWFRTWNVLYKYQMCVQYKWSFHTRNPRETAVTRKAIQTYIQMFTSLLSAYVIYLTFKWVRIFFICYIFINRVKSIYLIIILMLY
jgi:hypothetical protein